MWNKLRNADFYRKIPKDLTEGTYSGGSLSVGGAVFMFILFMLELNNYMTTNTVSRIVMDTSNDDMLLINFNVTLPKLPCQYASVDVSDVLGTRKVNLTKNIRKWRVGENGNLRLHEVKPEPVKIAHEEIQHPEHVHSDDEKIAKELDGDTFENFIKPTQITMVNFYAPWCIWSQRLKPVWEHTAGLVEAKPYGKLVKFARVDCTADRAQELCRKNHINAFPSMIVYREGKPHSHEQYHMDRTSEALISFVEETLQNMGQPITDANVVPQMDADADPIHVPLPPTAGPQGCMIAGSVLVRKIPGNLVFTASSNTHSFAKEMIDTSHRVHHFSYGTELSKRETQRLPADALSNRLDGLDFESKLVNCTHEHYIKVVSTRYEFLSAAPLGAYKYTVNSHVYEDHVTEVMPAAKFTFDLSPMSVVVAETATPFFKFLTSLCAIIGGVFTVIGLVDSVVYHSLSSLVMKNQLGKAT